jgi:hypothetical protein
MAGCMIARAGLDTGRASLDAQRRRATGHDLVFRADDGSPVFPSTVSWLMVGADGLEPPTTWL